MFQQTENKRRHAWPRKGSGMCRGCHVATHYRIATAFLHIDLVNPLSTRCQPTVNSSLNLVGSISAGSLSSLTAQRHNRLKTEVRIPPRSTAI
jgi:hypothetical protein